MHFLIKSYMIDIRISEVSMLEKEQNRVIVCRKPRVSTTVDRKKVTGQMRDTILMKKNEIIVKRTGQFKKAVTSVEKTEQQVLVQPQARPTAKELKDTAIEKALASTMKTQVVEKSPKMHFGFKRILLALACSVAAVFAIVYFVNLNAPNISLKVAAMQTGIEASYPSYVPRDYSLSDITSESGRITLNFKNSSTSESFTLTEEKSSWDTNALLNNYVRKEYKDDYSVIKEQGLTIYVSNSNATWVNGGIVYKLNAPANSLTKKQIKSIAVSL